MIHYVVEEAVKSGIEQVIFVNSYGKHSVENYFDRNYSLEKFLDDSKKESDLDLIRKVSKMVEVVTVRQKEQLGLGHAILSAEKLVGDERFAVLLGDDLIVGDVPCTKQLIDFSNKQNNSSVIGVMEVPKEEVTKYGIVSGSRCKEDTRGMLMTTMVEKPKVELAPSNWATPGRYVLNSTIFEYLKRIKPGAGNEYQLTDAINLECQEKQVFAYLFEGKRYDTGQVMGYLDATIAFALGDPRFTEGVKKLISKYSSR